MDKQIQKGPGKQETDRDLRENNQAENTNEQAESDRKNRRWVRNIPLLIVEICVLVAAVVIMYVVVTTTDEVERKDIDKEQILMNEEVKETHKREEQENRNVSGGYRNIALFGVDARDGQLGKGTRSDTIIIASINQDTQEIKLVSVFRDTYLNLSNDTYNKCNVAYALWDLAG